MITTPDIYLALLIVLVLIITYSMYSAIKYRIDELDAVQSKGPVDAVGALVFCEEHDDWFPILFIDSMGDFLINTPSGNIVVDNSYDIRLVHDGDFSNELEQDWTLYRCSDDGVNKEGAAYFECEPEDSIHVIFYIDRFVYIIEGVGYSIERKVHGYPPTGSVGHMLFNIEKELNNIPELAAFLIEHGSEVKNEC